MSKLDQPPPEGNTSCRHSNLYEIAGVCGLCFIQSRYDSEVPSRLHAYKVLAENGNPETHTVFLAHQETVLGLVPPASGQNLRDFRLARAQYTVARGLFPVTTAMVKAMGYQPPLVLPVVRAVQGFTEAEIAAQLDDSLWSIHIRISKGIRVILRNYRDGEKRSRTSS